MLPSPFDFVNICVARVCAVAFHYWLSLFVTYVIASGVRWSDVLGVMNNKHARARLARWDYMSMNQVSTTKNPET